MCADNPLGRANAGYRVEYGYPGSKNLDIQYPGKVYIRQEIICR